MSVGYISFGLVDVLNLSAEIIRQSRIDQAEARDEKKTLMKKLENASPEDAFKYMNLISVANIDEFVAESRLNAQQSFKFCLIFAVVGFLVICASVGFAIYFQFAQIDGMTATYLGAGSGGLIEAVSAFFFTLYAKTTTQVNRLHDRLLGSQSAYASVLCASLISTHEARDRKIGEVADKLVQRFQSLDQRI
jgi:hypothetical protein